MGRRAAAVVVSAALLSGCAETGTATPAAPTAATTAAATAEPSTAEPSTAEPSDAPVAEAPPAPPAWTVGASPLPLRPDGFGQVLATPEVLRDRQLPTVDVLPPPADGEFAATVAPVSSDVRARMGDTWSPACPVGLEDLRHLTLVFHGFDGRAHTGELVVAAHVTDDVVEVFRRLYDARFPLEQMRLPTTADLEAAPTGDGSNTAAYVCRAARGQTRWSEHAYGTAVDINPFHNPLVRRDLVVPELASAYADRGWERPGMHLPGGPAVRAFGEIGWTWGGTWRSSKDWMHFSLGGS